MAAVVNEERCNGCGACARICPTGAIAGEKKSLHVIDPRRCLECGACGKICPVAAVRDAFGIVCHRVKRSAWEKPRLDEKLCMSCGICVEVCPFEAIFWSPEFEYSEPRIDDLIHDKERLGEWMETVPEFEAYEAGAEAKVKKVPK